jgi:hypothetical protein
MDNAPSTRFQISLFGLLGIVAAVAAVLGLARYLGFVAPTILIGWYTALCFCRRKETIGFVFFGVPLLAVLGGGILWAIIGPLIRAMGWL